MWSHLRIRRKLQTAFSAGIKYRQFSTSTDNLMLENSLPDRGICPSSARCIERMSLFFLSILRRLLAAYVRPPGTQNVSAFVNHARKRDFQQKQGRVG